MTAVAAAFLALVSVPACGATYCSLIGATNGFSVTLDVPAEIKARAATIQTCVADACQARAGSDFNTDKVISVDDGNVPHGSHLSVVVKLLDGNGRRLAGGTADVVPQQYQPNGPGCDPLVWIAHVTADTSGLTPTR